MTVVEGDTARLTCVATGDPIPVLMWYQNGTEVPNPFTPRYQVSSNGTTLTVEQVVEEEDEGVFVCVATNVAGTDQDTVSLSVYSESILSCYAQGMIQSKLLCISTLLCVHSCASMLKSLKYKYTSVRFWLRA